CRRSRDQGPGTRGPGGLLAGTTRGTDPSRADAILPATLRTQPCHSATPRTLAPAPGPAPHEHHPPLPRRPVSALRAHARLAAAGGAAGADGDRPGGAAQRWRAEHGAGEVAGGALRGRPGGDVAAVADSAAAAAARHAGVL